ncbi:putative membrane protein YkgB [Saccharomonospora amisosensis]|uniref:Putative membrane protein YkgB n=1 Tax=Saccharomonospora amisosensis TaxID=1128677 RepID=A0A7X5ZS82_9PSEU|nr:hypothetical protein [Saccharomonospora amisosensis]NIJ13075.1 putative membrane protein YkgB [Saccharomonospora amisosensis]
MGPLLALVGITLLLIVLGRRRWHVALRGGLAVMFTMAATLAVLHAYRPLRTTRRAAVG